MRQTARPAPGSKSTTRRPTSGVKPPPLPEPRHHTAGVAMGGLYVIGGFATNFQDARADVFLYTPSRNQWTPVDPLVNGRGGHAAVVVGFSIYAVGGVAAGAADALENVAAVERFDPRSGEWRETGDLPTPRDHLAAVNSSGAVETIGGRLLGDFSQKSKRTRVPHHGRMGDTRSPAEGSEWCRGRGVERLCVRLRRGGTDRHFQHSREVLSLDGRVGDRAVYADRSSRARCGRGRRYDLRDRRRADRRPLGVQSLASLARQRVDKQLHRA